VTAVFESAATTVANGMVRAVLVDPWQRSCRPVTVPLRARPCGCCWSVNDLALTDLLGRWQRCVEAQNGEWLVHGLAVTAPRWTWGETIQVRGFGLVLGGHYRGGFSDSRALPVDIEAMVQWPRRRQAARAA
jgi:hypothetical protein